MISLLPVIDKRTHNIDPTNEITRVFLRFVQNYPRFAYWSGSHNEKLHHYGRYGLNVHTCEVIELGLDAIEKLHLPRSCEIEYFFAALFHDAGKMYDYDEVEPNVWKPTEHRRLIHHISRSSIIWHDTIEAFPELAMKYHDSVLHAILAHHGNREQGSPVAPKSRVAWLLHLCDSISARMNDCDTLDILHPPKSA